MPAARCMRSPRRILVCFATLFAEIGHTTRVRLCGYSRCFGLLLGIPVPSALYFGQPIVHSFVLLSVVFSQILVHYAIRLCAARCSSVPRAAASDASLTASTSATGTPSG